MNAQSKSWERVKNIQVNLRARFWKPELGGKSRKEAENKGVMQETSPCGWFEKVGGQKGAN